MIMNIILCMIWLLIVPMLLGMLYTYIHREEKNNIFFLFLVGYIIQFATFEIIALPATFFKLSFTTLLYIWSIGMGVLSIVSIWLNRKKMKDFILENIKQIKTIPTITFFVIVLILLQMFMVFRYMHVDDDDSFYVADATTSIETNTINLYNPTKGNQWDGWQTRYVLSPFPIYLATISVLTNMHPAIMAHTILPIILIPMMYVVFGRIANILFQKDQKKVAIFLLVLNILCIFGNYSQRTSFTMLFFRIWQGKAVLANIILPTIWYFVLKNMEEHKTIDFIMLILVMTAACLVSSMGVPLAPITLMSMIGIYSIRDKKIAYIWQYLIACIPCIICGMIYLLLA